ncbi:MAG: sterol desaturase family protein [Myxococcota bacterium]
MEQPAGAVAAESPRDLREAFGLFARQWSPRILAGLLLVSLLARGALGAVALDELIAAAIVFALWPLLEWLIHVFVLHHRPRRIFGFEWDYAVAEKHRAHHRDPARLELVLIPLHVYLFTPVTLGLVFWLIAPSARVGLTGLCVYFALALHYEWVHFLVHTHVRPRGRYYQRLFRNHRLHHFKNEHYWFGVTRLGGDRLLGTAPDPAQTERSASCRELFSEAEGSAASRSAG